MVWDRVSLLAKVMFQKAAMKELISVASLLALLGKKLFSAVSLNWFLVKSGMFN